MEKEKIIFAINKLPDEKFVEILDFIAEDTEYHENTADNLNMVFDGGDSMEIIRAMENSNGRYSTKDKWFSYNFKILLSSNSLRSLIPNYDSFVDYVAGLYLDGGIDDDIDETIVAILREISSFPSVSDNHKRQVDYEDGYDKGFSDGFVSGIKHESKCIANLINAMVDNGEADMLQAVLNDDTLKKAYYKKYNIQ